MKPKRPTPTQAVLRRMAAGLPLVRLRGGFWTTVDDRPRRTSHVDAILRSTAPSWSVGARTVYAMQAHGWLALAGRNGNIWADDRVLTDAGRELAKGIK